MLNYDQIKKALKQNGFNYVKLEFEADVTGGDPCEYCDMGTVECCDCGGRGYLSIVNQDGDEIDTTNCNCDNGSVTCPDCNGHWEGDANLEDFEKAFIENMPKSFKYAFIKTYNDGSVNTEVTMTFAIRYLHHIEKVIKAFAKTCEDIGDFDTDNAGFHISLLETRNYSENISEMKQLPQDKINNFLRSMDKIVDAMYLLSSGNGKETRSLQYRGSKVSSIDKYSAIFTHNNTCIEYRIFDTCYRNPERFLNFMNLIVRTLKFYSTKHFIVDKNWLPYNLIGRDGSAKELDKMMSGNWKEFLFGKLTYLYSDRSKLNKLETYNKSGMISDKTTLLELAK